MCFSVTGFFRRLGNGLLVCCMTIVFSGCTTMSLPQRLNESQLSVETSGGFFSTMEYYFEDWAVSEVTKEHYDKNREEKKERWTSSHKVKISYEYFFNLMFKNEVKHRVECFARFDESGSSVLGIQHSRDKTILKCGILNPVTGGVEGKIDSIMEEEGMNGLTTFGENQFSIYSQYTAAATSIFKPPSPYGYIIYRDSDAVAAIQLTHDRFIWIHPSVREEFGDHLAAVLMALAYFVKLDPPI
jgi:hypothetical protein